MKEEKKTAVRKSVAKKEGDPMETHEIATSPATRKTAKKRSVRAPAGDRRLNINIQEDAYKLLKMVAIQKDLTAGEIVENLVLKHLKL